MDDSYGELASRFLTLEGAIDYATQICPNEPEFFQTGFDLCELVIKAPGADAISAQYASEGKIVANLLTGNKYATQSNQEDYSRAKERKNQIKRFGDIIKVEENKYFNGLVRLGIKNSDATRTTVHDEKIVKDLQLEKSLVISVFLNILIFPFFHIDFTMAITPFFVITYTVLIGLIVRKKLRQR